MLQEISPHVYYNQFEHREVQPDDILLYFEKDRAMLRLTDGALTLPRLSEFPEIAPSDCRTLFRIDDTWYCMVIDKKLTVPEGYSFYPFREYRNFRPMEKLFPYAVAGSLIRWYQDNRFCGRCGHRNEDSPKERALVCPECGRTLYPKICPAVIVAVRNGNRLLLTRYANRPSVGYALIAGFAEIGEPIEATVHREVMEECGIKVKNLQFYKSQPWVFTDTLLMGFYCDLDGDETITLQEDELSVGEWIDRDKVPEDTTHLSLTSEMIERFRVGLA